MRMEFVCTVRLATTILLPLITCSSLFGLYVQMFSDSAISAEYAFPRVLGVMLLTTLTALAMGMLFSSIANSYEQATTYSMMSILFMIFAGFFIPQASSLLFTLLQCVTVYKQIVILILTLRYNCLKH